MTTTALLHTDASITDDDEAVAITDEDTADDADDALQAAAPDQHAAPAASGEPIPPPPSATPTPAATPTAAQTPELLVLTISIPLTEKQDGLASTSSIHALCGQRATPRGLPTHVKIAPAHVTLDAADPAIRSFLIAACMPYLGRLAAERTKQAEQAAKSAALPARTQKRTPNCTPNLTTTTRPAQTSGATVAATTPPSTASAGTAPQPAPIAQPRTAAAPSPAAPKAPDSNQLSLFA